MDLEHLEQLNEIRLSVYRVGIKLLNLQRRCHLDVVSVRHITEALQQVGGATRQLNRQEVIHVLNRTFINVSQEVPGHVIVETSDVMFTLYDRCHVGSLSAASLQTALIALSNEALLDKYRALVRVAVDTSGSVSRCSLRCLLQALSQVPAIVQEGGMFGGVEAALTVCFDGVSTATTNEEHVLLWLQSEPRLLLWLPTLYRLSVSQHVSHSVRCHACKSAPIRGLRYRCLKCVNVHLCQSCFLTDRQMGKHKTHHPVLEFCTQPTWRESVSSLVHSARYVLLPRQYTRRAADRKRVLMCVEPETTQERALPPCHRATPLAAVAVTQRLPSEISQDASLPPPPLLSLCSKALQTEEMLPPQMTSTLTTEVRNLQRDKWLLEQQLQAWRLTVQSEQGILEDRCAEMEVTMETLREHNFRLQNMLTQAVTKMEGQVETYTHRKEEEQEKEQGEEEKEEEEEDQDKEEEEEEQTASPTLHQDRALSHDLCCEGTDSADDAFQYQSIDEQGGAEEEDACLSEEVEHDGRCIAAEHDGRCSVEQQLQEAVDRLRTMMTVMETSRYPETQAGELRWAELLEAAEQVGDSLQHLVDAVGTTEEQETHS